ncbi:hypothetical protein EX30DRAFT_272868 [Ascodesmis nigricans]|uniref:Uncharacterized protein n=1 Tax=Ascodesmis nigricans TaxID=341454 RepID=A0A4V3SIS3_9PEZI|nr:hypothetical protein EX30DRAFT_272868 [Ascodesmis nigricans]
MNVFLYTPLDNGTLLPPYSKRLSFILCISRESSRDAAVALSSRMDAKRMPSRLHEQRLPQQSPPHAALHLLSILPYLDIHRHPTLTHPPALHSPPSSESSSDAPNGTCTPRPPATAETANFVISSTPLTPTTESLPPISRLFLYLVHSNTLLQSCRPSVAC